MHLKRKQEQCQYSCAPSMSADSKLGREVRSDCRSQSRRRRNREPGWRPPRWPSSRSPFSGSGGAGSHWVYRPSSSRARLPPLFNMTTSSRQRSSSHHHQHHLGRASVPSGQELPHHQACARQSPRRSGKPPWRRLGEGTRGKSEARMFP